MKNPFYLFIIALLSVACSSGSGSETEEAHGHEHEGESMEVELTPLQMETVGIRLGAMERREMADVLSVAGTLEVPPQGEALATSKAAGTVVRICVAQGQSVRAGQTVAYVDSPEIGLLQQDLPVAAEETAAARRELERQQALADQGAGIRKNLDAARSALATAEIRERALAVRLQSYGAAGSGSVAVTAPISGVVVSVDTEIGAFADMQVPIARIVNPDATFCQLQILEKDVTRVGPGMEVKMRLTNDPSVTFSGTVAEVTPALDPQSKTIPVKVTLSERPASLVPGMAVSAQVSASGALVDVLPEDAVVSAGGKHYIFVVADETHLHNASDEHSHGAYETHDHDTEAHSHDNSDAQSHDAPETHSHDASDAPIVFRKVEVIVGETSFGYVAVTPVQPLPTDARIVVSGAFYLNSMSSDHGEHSH